MTNVTVLDGSSLPEAGPCTKCGKKTNYKCNRCGDFYCSVKCQRKDWPYHRYICFPMPKLVNVRRDSITDTDLPGINFELKHAANGKNLSNNKNSASCANLQTRIPDGSCVSLTCFMSSNRCFVRSMNPSDIVYQERILDQIDNFGKQSSPLTSRLKVNSFALALKNERWCRVKILGYQNKEVLVAFKDFGDKSSKSLNEMRESTAAIDNLPYNIQRVHLKGINTNFSNKQLLNSLNQFVNKEYKIVYSEPDKKAGHVELFKWGTSISLNSLIQELLSKQSNNGIENKSAVSLSNVVEVPKNDLSSSTSNENDCKINKALNKSNEFMIEESQSSIELEEMTDDSLVSAKLQRKNVSSMPHQIPMEKPCLIPPFDIIPINENDHDSQVMIMDTSFLQTGFIGCMLEKCSEYLKAITEFLNEYEIGEHPYKPKANEYVLAEFDNMWYRAKVVEIVSDDKFLVVYIDFTNEKELSSCLIRRYPLILDSPCCTTLCGIDGLPDDLSEELNAFLKKTVIPFSKLKIDSIKMKDNTCYLTFNELLQNLRDSKLI